MENNKNLDMNRNPTGKGGFGDNPQNIGNGRPKNEQRVGYWLQFFKDMTGGELKNYVRDENTPDGLKSVDEMYVAEILAYQRVIRARKDLNEYKEVVERTEGKSPQTLIHEGGFFSDQKLTVEVVRDVKIEDNENTEE